MGGARQQRWVGADNAVVEEKAIAAANPTRKGIRVTAALTATSATSGKQPHQQRLTPKEKRLKSRRNSGRKCIRQKSLRLKG